MYLNHSAIEFYFSKNSRNFIVEELPLYPFSGCGEHLILKIRKKNITTLEMLNILSKNLNIKRSEIGYAGLKDKNSLSIQYISINKKLIKNIESINIENIKILDTTYHNNKIKLGHLSGNKFFVRIKKLNKTNALKLNNICKIILKDGMPNYFGYQRFGNYGDNHKEGRAILDSKLKIRDHKTSLFLISAYQSYLFNMWLKDRIEFSKIINEFNINDASSYLNIDKSCINILKQQKHFFKIFDGDIMKHYPNGKLFYNEDSKDSSLRFYNKKISPTGLLYGSNVLLSKNKAYDFESKYLDSLLNKTNGGRRFAWIFLDHLEFIYKEDIANGEFNFTLPKGSYATILIDTLTNNPIKNK